MLPSKRQKALRFLHSQGREDALLCRSVEAGCHAASDTEADYFDHVLRCAFNLSADASCGIEVLSAPDAWLARGTVVGAVEAEKRSRAARFEAMLQEKYDALDDETFKAIVKCGRCGSENVRWEEKQTRSADEGGTVFCTCLVCKNRWVMK